ncbi:MAG: ABC transporter ATP-binding protein/permease [Clostridiales bacterium]|nr:ABC transporter ATP-binding protein/permease [Clostridiales bacterium]
MKKHNIDTIRWLWSVSASDKWSIFWMALVQTALGICSVLSAWLLRGIIDCAVAGTAVGFWRYSASLLLLLAAQLALLAVNRHLTEAAKSSLENRFKHRLFSMLLRKDYAAVTAVHSGEWMNRLTSDTAVVSDGLATILPEVMGMLVKLVGALALLLYLMPALAYVILPGGLILVLLTYAFRKTLKRLHKRIQEADGRLRVFLTERLSSMLIVRTFGKAEQTEQEAAEKMAEHRQARMSRNRFSNLCNIGFGAVMSGAYVLGAVYCGYGILVGTMSYGTFTAVLQLISQIQSPFANITGYLPKCYAMLASAERLMEAEDYEEDSPEPQLSEREAALFYQNELVSIGLANAGFTYHSDGNSPTVISGLNLTVQKGDYVAFTGHSGCGKSTVLKLLMSLYPLDSGERYLYTANGKAPLSARYRGLFAYVPQGNQLLSGTIREVIAFGDAEAMQDEARLRLALEISCADEFVDTLEHGLDTMLGEHGAGLSEGQMQRIAIARAVFSEHPILMLDEATSSLDEATEAKLLANLRAMTDKTVLIVTHRPAVLEICDRVVLFMGDGAAVTVQETQKGV